LIDRKKNAELVLSFTQAGVFVTSAHFTVQCPYSTTSLRPVTGLS